MRLLPRLFGGGSRDITHVSKATETGIPDDAGQKIVKWGTVINVALIVGAAALSGRYGGVDATLELASKHWHWPIVIEALVLVGAGVIVICRMVSEIWYKNHPTHAQINTSRLMGPFGWKKEEHNSYDRRAWRLDDGDE